MASQMTRNRRGKGRKRKEYKDAVPGSRPERVRSRSVVQLWTDQLGNGFRTRSEALRSCVALEKTYGKALPKMKRLVAR